MPASSPTIKSRRCAPNGNPSGVPPGVIVADQLPDSALVRLRTVEMLLGVSASTVWRLAKKGFLKPIRVGASTRWRIGDIRALTATEPRPGVGRAPAKLPQCVGRIAGARHEC